MEVLCACWRKTRAWVDGYSTTTLVPLQTRQLVRSGELSAIFPSRRKRLRQYEGYLKCVRPAPKRAQPRSQGLFGFGGKALGTRLKRLRQTPRKDAFLPCGHLDFQSAVTAQNDEFNCSSYSSYSRLLISKRSQETQLYLASIITDNFAKYICRNVKYYVFPRFSCGVLLVSHTFPRKLTLFSPKSDQVQIFPAASPVMLHHTV